MTSIPTTPAARPTTVAASGLTSTSAGFTAFRLAVFTAWLALAVPLTAVIELAFILNENPFIASTDPAAATAFAGGAAIGLAIWMLCMRIVIRRQRRHFRVPNRTIWWLLAPWLPALGTWYLLRHPLSGGIAAVVAMVVLLAGWFGVWRAATVALR